MNKRLNVLLLFFIVVFAVSFTINLDRDVIKETRLANDNINSYAVNVNLDFIMSDGEQQVSSSFSSSAYMDFFNKKMQLFGRVSKDDIDTQLVSYVDDRTVYTSEGDSWNAAYLEQDVWSRQEIDSILTDLEKANQTSELAYYVFTLPSLMNDPTIKEYSKKVFVNRYNYRIEKIEEIVEVENGKVNVLTNRYVDFSDFNAVKPIIFPDAIDDMDSKNIPIVRDNILTGAFMLE